MLLDDCRNYYIIIEFYMKMLHFRTVPKCNISVLRIYVNLFRIPIDTHYIVGYTISTSKMLGLRPLVRGCYFGQNTLDLSVLPAFCGFWIFGFACYFGRRGNK